MIVIRAQHAGMCFGVRDAVEMARREAARRPLTVLGDLVHNPAVLDRLRREGVQFESDPERVRTSAVMVTAHGASRKALRELTSAGFEVLEATCPLVHHAHRALERLVAAGYHPVVVGIRGHAEVRGLVGDHPGADIILEPADVDRMEERSRFGVVAQTTQTLDRVRDLVARLRSRFPEAEVRLEDTVCLPTRQRQRSVEDLARGSDVVVVVGGRTSNNTARLAETASRWCDRVHAVEGADDLRRDWFLGSDVVGVTAGTSTADPDLDAVEARLRSWASVPCGGVATPVG